MYMPSILFKSIDGVEVTVVTDQEFTDVTSVPSGNTWLTDGSVTGYDGLAEILVYHPEPPYNHQVLVENQEYIYIYKTGSNYYKVQFLEYDDVVIFDFDEL